MPLLLTVGASSCSTSTRALPVAKLAINNKPLPAALIKFQVRHGLGAPAYKADHIDQRELDLIAAYLIALRRS